MSVIQRTPVLELYEEQIPEKWMHLACDGELRVDAVVYAEPFKDDFGVPGSPVWTDYEITDVEVFVNDALLRTAPDEFHEIACDMAIKFDEWETCE
jgi:hypothetical protein